MIYAGCKSLTTLSMLMRLTRLNVRKPHSGSGPISFNSSFAFSMNFELWWLPEAESEVRHDITTGEHGYLDV